MLTDVLSSFHPPYIKHVHTTKTCQQQIKKNKQNRGLTNICISLSGNEHCWVGTNSRSYFGIQSVTKNNHQCQLWTLQYPHVHTRNKDEQFPQDGSVYTAVNFCRDPDKKGKPWCYTREPNVPWEYCDVPICKYCTAHDCCLIRQNLQCAL